MHKKQYFVILNHDKIHEDKRYHDNLVLFPTEVHPHKLWVAIRAENTRVWYKLGNGKIVHKNWCKEIVEITDTIGLGDWGGDKYYICENKKDGTYKFMSPDLENDNVNGFYTGTAIYGGTYDIPIKGKCGICKKTTLLRDATVDNKQLNVCDQCYKKTFRYCERCDSPMNTNTGEDYCYACKKRMKPCEICGKIRNNLVFYNDKKICEDCLPKNVLICNNCGDAFTKNDKRVNEYCPKCTDRKDIRRPVHDYGYSPSPIFFSGDNDNLFFGIELEIKNPLKEKNQLTYNLLKAVNKDADLIYFKNDHSIIKDEYDGGGDRYGPHFEMVTHPFNFAWLKQNRNAFDDIFNLTNVGCKSFDTTTCGMHVHMSMEPFSNIHMYKFLSFIYSPTNKDFLIKVSDREDLVQLEKYSTFNLDKYGSSIKHLTRYRRNDLGDHRHIAANLSTAKTVEIRIFRGTLDKTRFFKNIEFCKAVYDFTEKCSMKHCTVEHFKSFVASNRKTFKNLAHFILESK